MFREVCYYIFINIDCLLYGVFFYVVDYFLVCYFYVIFIILNECIFYVDVLCDFE